MHHSKRYGQCHCTVPETILSKDNQKVWVGLAVVKGDKHAGLGGVVNKSVIEYNARLDRRYTHI